MFTYGSNDNINTQDAPVTPLVQLLRLVRLRLVSVPFPFALSTEAGLRLPPEDPHAPPGARSWASGGFPEAEGVPLMDGAHATKWRPAAENVL